MEKSKTAPLLRRAATTLLAAARDGASTEAAGVQPEESEQQIQEGIAKVEASSSPWAKLKAAAETGTAAMSIDDEDQRLRDLNASVAEVVTTSTKEVMSSAKVPVAAFGRVKDITDRLKAQVNEMTAEAWNAEHKAAREQFLEQLETQKADLEAEFEAKLKGEISKIQAERDATVEKAMKEKKEMKREYDALVERSSSSEELLKKGEQAVAEAQKKQERWETEAKRIKEENKLRDEVWSTTLAEALADCSLKGRKEEKKEDNAKMWRAKQKSASEQLRIEIERYNKEPAEQLRVIVKAYEQALNQTSELSEDEKSEGKKAIAKAQKAQADAEEQRKREVTDLKEELERVKQALAEAELISADLNKQMQSIHKVAKDEAREQSRLFEVELNEKAAKLQATADEKTIALEKLQEELATTKSQFQSYVESSGSLLQAQQQKLTKVLTALKVAQSAGKNGGYYFAAAPTKPGRGALAAMLAEHAEAEAAEAASPGRSPLGAHRPGSRSTYFGRSPPRSSHSPNSPSRRLDGSPALRGGPGARWPISTPWEEQQDDNRAEVTVADPDTSDATRLDPPIPGENPTPAGSLAGSPALHRPDTTPLPQDAPPLIDERTPSMESEMRDRPPSSTTPSSLRRPRQTMRRKTGNSFRKPGKSGGD